MAIYNCSHGNRTFSSLAYAQKTLLVSASTETKEGNKQKNTNTIRLNFLIMSTRKAAVSLTRNHPLISFDMMRVIEKSFANDNYTDKYTFQFVTFDCLDSSKSDQKVLSTYIE